MPTQVAPDPVHQRRPAAPDGAAARGARRRLVLQGIAAGLLLLAAHASLMACWPRLTGGELRVNLNLCWLVANGFVAAVVLLRDPPPTWRTWVMAGLGYGLVVGLMWQLIAVLDENVLLLALCAMLYGGLLRHPFLLGYLYLFLLCQRFLPAYLYPAFLLSALLYSTLPPFLEAWRQQRQFFRLACHIAGLILLTSLLLPVSYYVLGGSAQDLNRELRSQEVREALAVSFRTSAVATLLILLFGIPLAYSLVRVKFPGRALIDTIVDLPIVVPAPIAGLMLLSFTGPRSPLGAWLEAQWGITLVDSEYGIVMAQAFVSSPFLIRAAMIAFAAVDVRFENVARTLGARPVSAFFRITLPLALPGILIGTMLSWFRAVAEFGALRIMGNRPLTMPILAFERFNSYNQAEAQSIGVLILLMCFGVIAGMWIIRTIPVVVRRSLGAVDAAR